MSTTPRGERLIIALLGRRNAGKSSLINALIGQEVAIVSETAGTTTDPVAKHYELAPLGPVTFYDTAGLDDEGELGQKRVASTRKILYRADIVIFINDGSSFVAPELDMLALIREMKIPVLMVFNKIDVSQPIPENILYCQKLSIPYVSLSAKAKTGILQAKEALVKLAPQPSQEERVILSDIIKAKDRVILVCPIDAAAPKGRLILPQVQSLREILDSDAIGIVVKDTELKDSLAMLAEPPDLVVTDSQAIEQVNRETPEPIELTTFSILFARYKGELDILLTGIDQIDLLQDGDKVMIAEACSHHAQKDDIGRVKLPRWISEYTGKKLSFEVFAGHDFPESLEDFALCIHCGGCMINAAEMNRRIQECYRRKVPITNYGLTICKVHGAFDRAIAPLMRTRK
ncbi:MAG: [FeFe] hydrogenase H-cluster maturation GTPase HydF [Candidatus Cloacimonadaceae bacterium]|nr:[FeFe] hydrogenase H-cluster maturation GTPase HydF [Candidatus Cloacimonadota bacterium]MDY0127032.1 [FeFe] hydrogenase H-cluster maturation GTPase HydF [Candidatus Cloacimonadaceae bacterium]MCB5254104.1 [FeFe] hydrogenase H-cluster maturation GTPase HydF [Candidatus Cloacimonadota bacterium]MCK9177691.1 [FeFe] hydrogenase H-cluster maturation GTPase HydF [Candidatus Cloacimonadota bacterium]MCK9241664.1 [FeFe] hydrogenase H-cluster maturation GTPase HydF [Candidatus Cloacimonadota bacteri